MERSIEYVQGNSNFNSGYNAPVNVAPPASTYVPLTSWATFSTLSNRPTSPLFRRTISPPPRRPLLPEPGPKFNFNLYKMDESIADDNGYISPPYRALSPTSSSIIHHRSLYSPLSSPDPRTQSFSRLREINDELSQTLARADFSDLSLTAPHYHIHHYPVSQLPHQTYRSRSIYDEYSPTTDFEVSSKLHKARVTYRVHFPEQHQSPSRKTSRYTSPSSSSSSDTSANEEPIVIDLYPTRDQGFVKGPPRYADNQSPWIVEGTSLRRGSYSGTSTPRSSKTHKGLYYGDKPLKSRRRSVRDKERPSSSSRNRMPHTSSRTSPSSRTYERVWHPPSRTTSDRPPKYFQPIGKPEHDMSTRVRAVIDETESEPASQRKTVSHRTDIRTTDPKFKRRIANAESKVKSAWEPTVTGLSPSAVKGSKPPTPQPVKQTTIVTPRRSHDNYAPSKPTTPVKKAVSVPPQPSTTASTGRSSVNDIPAKPIFESTPRDQSVAEKDNESVDAFFGNESHASEQADKNDVPHTSPPPPPEPARKPSTELPKSPVSEPEKEASTIMDDKDQGNDHDEHQPPASTSDAAGTNKNDGSDTAKTHDTPPPPPPPEVPNPERKAPSSKSDQKNDKSVAKDNHDDGDENDQEVANSFDINKWLTDASKEIHAAAKSSDVTPPKPPAPPQAPPVKNPPRRKVQPPSPPQENSDENLYKPPFGPKRADPKPSASPPPAGDTNEVDNFFN